MTRVCIILVSILVANSGCNVLRYKKIVENRFLYAQEHKPFDVLLVPGTPIKSGEWSELFIARMLWSKYLYENGFVKKIIFSGGAIYTPYVEGEVMAEFAKRIGIPEEAILVERNAEHSVENIYNSYILAKEEGYQSMLVSTDLMQSFRYALFQKKSNIAFNTIPVVENFLDRELELPEFDVEPYRKTNWKHINSRKNLKEFIKATSGRNLPSITRKH